MSAEPQRELIVRVLPPEEWWRVEDTFIRGDDRLSPSSSVVLVVEALGHIIGAVAVHQIAMVGLMTVDERFQDKGVGTLLTSAIANLFTRGESIFTLTTNEATARLAESQGAVRVDGQLWRKDF